MALESDRPVTVILKGPIGVRLENEIITALQTVVGPGGTTVPVGGSGEGSPISIVLMRGRTVSGLDEPIGLEDSREIRITLHGEDEAGNIDPLRTDPGGILWMRSYENSIIAAPSALPGAEAILWTPPAPQTAAELYEVDFFIVNVAGAPTGPITVGVDINAGGALAGNEFWMYQEILPWPGTSGWRGSPRQGFLCRGADTIRGVNTAGGGLAVIHFRVRRIDTNI